MERKEINQKEINRAEWSNPDNWSVGFYFSKKDSRAWVPKSIPWIGWTVNLGSREGAFWMIGFLMGLPLQIVLLMSFACGQ